MLAGALAGCSAMPGTGSWIGDLHAGNRAAPAASVASHGSEPLHTGSIAGTARPGFTVLGSDAFTGSVSQTREEPTAAGEPGITLNLVDVPIGQAAKTVLSDLLGMNFVIDDRVQGTMTVQTTSPVSKAALADVFETVLRSRGAAIVEDAGFKRILPIEDARARAPGAFSGVQAVRPGLAIQIVPLAYVSAEEMRGILQPIVPSGGILRVDAARNLLMISGTASELASIRETVALFDVDQMKGMSFALHPVRSSDPEAISAELQTVFQAGGASAEMVRFIPNRRLNAVLIVSPRAHYLKEAATWIDRLDQGANAQEERLVVYPIRNRTAAEVAPILRSIFGSGDGVDPVRTGSVAPNLAPVQIRSDSADLIAMPPPSTSTDPGSASQRGSPGISADEANNSLLVFASDREHERIAAVLYQIDRMPTQVLLEATIAEVTLTDELRFGLRWFFEKGGSSGTFTDTTAGSVSATFPGFSYLFSTGDFKVVLNALASVTDVKIVSSPSLMVLDNKEATLQVGDQVPVITQTAQSTGDPDAPIVNSVELRDTGVILRVRPHVNESGRVVLDIQQEVSSVIPTTTSGIDSPTIRQRRLATTVVVGDGESLTLGGLIQERSTQKRSKVPVLGDIPIVGNAFRQKQDDVERTELIVFIRPQVVHDVMEARMITEEYRNQLSIPAPGDRIPVETIRRDAARALN